MVGDVHGGVTLVKLSPNLTIGGKVPPNCELSIEEYEREKMESQFQMNVMDPALRSYNLNKLNDKLLMEKKFHRNIVEPASMRYHNFKK